MKEKLLTLLLIFTVLASGSTASAQVNQPPFQWEPVTINGQEYLPIEQLKIFYQLEENEQIGKKISLENKRVKIHFTLDDQAAYFNGVKIFLSEPIKEHQGTAHISLLDLSSLLDPVIRPKFIANVKKPQTIILDPGHGGKDRGAANLESSLTLSIAQKIQKKLQKKGYRVLLTRNSDITVPLEERVRISNNENNAILVSLHFNAGDKNVHGMETYIVSARKPHNAGAASAALAAAVHARCLMYLNDKRFGQNFEIEDRGIRHAKFRLLTDSKHPAILIEAGFLTNKNESVKVRSDVYQETLATSIVRGIDVYRTSVGAF